MARPVDNDILIGFIDEVNGYLPCICQGIEAVAADPSHPDGLREAHRCVHTIKGAASMIGFANLSHIANCLEETIEEITAGNLAVRADVITFLNTAVAQIEIYLDNVIIGGSDEHKLLADVSQAYQAIHGREMPMETPKADTQPRPARPGAPEPGVEAKASDSGPQADLELENEVSQELMEVFLVEADDHLHNIGGAMRALEAQPGKREVIEEIRRSVHTLKGAGAMVGFQMVTQLSHRMEDLLDLLYAGRLPVSSEAMDLLFTSQDILQDVIDGTVELPSLENLYGGYANLAGQAAPEEAGEEISVALQTIERPEHVDEGFSLEGLSDETHAIQSPSSREQAGENRQPGEAKRPSQMVRVPLERLDELVRMVSELAISRTTFENLLQEYRGFVNELVPSIERLRLLSGNIQSQYEVSSLESRWVIGGSQKPQAQVNIPYGFDSLELDRYTEFHRLSRELIETTSDIRTVGNELHTLVGDFDSILNRQGRISSDIQDRLMRVRMVPLANLSTRLFRTVRVLAGNQGKKVDFSIEGEQIQLDKTVLEEIADPLNHLLRNAVDHGIEPPDLRQALGKPARGHIHLRAHYQGNQVVIDVADDGAGLDLEALRNAAVKKDYLSDAEAAQMSAQELMGLVFLPGFSTVEEVSEVSGRGVGLDVVGNNVQKLKGAVSVSSVSGQGTTFTIRLPMTLAITRALLVRAHGETFAFPFNVVTQILRLDRYQFEQIGKETVVRLNGCVYPAIRLGEVLHLKQPADETIERVPALIFNAGDKQYALVVDQILSGREIVIKSLGSHLRQVRGISGATLMGDGSVVLILNPMDLVSPGQAAKPVNLRPSLSTRSMVGESHCVMIVDDSPSVRRVLANLMKNTGWQSLVAKDGLEALEILHNTPTKPDLLILDIEMPRMNGYELIQTLKSTAEYRGVPVVFLTSRAGEKHQQKAMELGAADCVVKPYQDEVLINLIRKHILAARSMDKE